MYILDTVLNRVIKITDETDDNLNLARDLLGVVKESLSDPDYKMLSQLEPYKTDSFSEQLEELEEIASCLYFDLKVIESYIDSIKSMNEEANHE